MERSVFKKEVKTQKLWTFELGTQGGINVPTWIINGFRHSERQDAKNINIDNFYRPPITSAQCIVGTAKYADAGILLNYDENDHSQ